MNLLGRRLGDRYIGRSLGLPPRENEYRIKSGIRVPMRDGVALSADVFIADDGAPGPVIVVRSPYGRGYPWQHLYARPFAARGFHVLVQSVRGTGGSGGVFAPAINEADDGADTIEWLRAQRWFNGRLATIGPSYLGLVQWAMMRDPPPELAAAVVLAAPHDLSAAWASGTFALRDYLGYYDGVAHLDGGASFLGQLRALKSRQRVDEAVTKLPLVAAARPLLGDVAPLYEQSLAHADRADPYWEPLRFDDVLDSVTVPILLVNGWQDTFLEQTLEQYRRLAGRGVEVAMTIGPWTHARLQRLGAEVFIGEALDWMRTHLLDRAASRRTPVRLFVRGATWSESAVWPPRATAVHWYLGVDGSLSTMSSPADAAPTTFTFDPLDPTPSTGGRFLDPVGGYVDDSSLATRDDVATFTSDPLAAALEIAGTPSCRLAHSSDEDHVDVAVRLSQVDADGRSTNVSDGYRCLPVADRSSPRSIEVTLDAVAHRFPAGARLRVVIAGGSFPRFARNPGTGETVATATDVVPVTHSLHHGAGGDSTVSLPVVRQA